jgi:acyl-homoserine-lactone acylase
MKPEVVSVGVLAGGVVVPVSHTFYQTQFGPVLVIPPLANWTTSRAYALTDVNLENSRAFRLYREMGTSRNLDEFAQLLRKYVALPWVNTIAADSQGNAFYGDITVVPHVTNAKLAACANTPVAQALSSARLYMLDGSTSQCDPGTDADAPVAGIFGAGNLPGIARRDYVQNSNDSYWLANPAARLEGYSKLIGADENAPQGFRTRLGITQIRDRQAGTDGLPGTGFGRQWLQDVLFGNRHYSAEIMLDGVLSLCSTENHVVNVGGTPVDVTEACNVLSTWDRHNRTASVGTHVWTEFWSRARSAPNVYAVPFDPADPVNTPRGVNLASASVRTRLMGDLGATVKYFADNGIPLNREWGRVQFDVRNGEAIPIHGGSGTSGVYNAIGPAGLVRGVGYASITNGSSYIQAVTFTPSGPDARALVTYSESSDPANPHYADLTRLFSGYGWVNMPFAEGDIRRDPNLTELHLKEKR